MDALVRRLKKTNLVASSSDDYRSSLMTGGSVSSPDSSPCGGLVAFTSGLRHHPSKTCSTSVHSSPTLQAGPSTLVSASTKPDLLPPSASVQFSHNNATVNNLSNASRSLHSFRTPGTTSLLQTPQAHMPLPPGAALNICVAALPSLDAPAANFDFFPHSPTSDTNADTTPSPLFAPHPATSLDEAKMLEANATANLDVTSLIKRSKRKAAATIGTTTSTGNNGVSTAAGTVTAGTQLSHRELLESVMFINSNTGSQNNLDNHGLSEVNFVSSAPGELFSRLLQGTEAVGTNSATGGATEGGSGPANTEEEDLALLVTTLTAISKTFEQHSSFPSGGSGGTAGDTMSGAPTASYDMAKHPLAGAREHNSSEGPSRRHLSQPRQCSPSASSKLNWSPITTHQQPHSDIYQPRSSLESLDQSGWTMTLPHCAIAHAASNTSSSNSAHNFDSATLPPVDAFGVAGGHSATGYTPSPATSQITAHQQQLLLQSIIGPAAAAAVQPHLSPAGTSIAPPISAHHQVASPPSNFPTVMWPPSEEDYLTVNGLSLRAWRSYLLNLACCTDTETLYARLSFGLASDLAQGRMPGYHNASAQQNATSNNPHAVGSLISNFHGTSRTSAPVNHQRTVSWSVPPPPNGLAHLTQQGPGSASQRPSINSSVNASSLNSHQLQQPQSQTATAAHAARQFPFATTTTTGGTGGVPSPTAPHLQMSSSNNVVGRIHNLPPSGTGSSISGGGIQHGQTSSQQLLHQPSFTSQVSGHPQAARGVTSSSNQPANPGERPPPSEGRFRQIARCKSTPEYLLYISRIPKHARGPDDPQTPRIAGTTWREFSTDVRVWKKALHRKKEAIEADEAARATAMGLLPPGDDGCMYGIGGFLPAVELPPSAAKMFVAGFGAAAAGMVPPPPTEAGAGGITAGESMG